MNEPSIGDRRPEHIFLGQNYVHSSAESASVNNINNSATLASYYRGWIHSGAGAVTSISPATPPKNTSTPVLQNEQHGGGATNHALLGGAETVTM